MGYTHKIERTRGMAQLRDKGKSKRRSGKGKGRRGGETNQEEKRARVVM
jgi:hypothetical protein